MGRIDEVPAPSRRPDQERLYQKVTASRGMFYSPYKIWIHSPEIGFGMETIGTHLNSNNASLSAAEMETVALVTARHWSATYVTKNHSGHAARAGIAEASISAINSGEVPKFEDQRLSAVYHFSSSALRGEILTDDQFDSYVRVLTRAGIAEILGAIGYFTSVSLAMKTHAIM